MASHPQHDARSTVAAPGISRRWRSSGTRGNELLTSAVAVVLITLLASFTSGVLTFAAGHKSRSILQIHQASAIVWVTVFAVHVLAYVPRVARSLRSALRATGEHAVPGAGVRASWWPAQPAAASRSPSHSRP